MEDVRGKRVVREDGRCKREEFICKREEISDGRRLRCKREEGRGKKL